MRPQLSIFTKLCFIKIYEVRNFFKNLKPTKTYALRESDSLGFKSKQECLVACVATFGLDDTLQAVGQGAIQVVDQ